jgi:hypothetical protein
MFRWNLMLRNRFASSSPVRKTTNPSVFGIRRDKRKPRSSRSSVKPNVEGLEERLVPSASNPDPSPAAAMAAQIVSAIDPEMVPLANAVRSFEQAILQAYAQEVSYVTLQVDQLLGITPNAPTPVSTTTVPQPSSGSGSGSGVTNTAQNAPNQHLQPITSKSGSGSGSGVTTTAHENGAKAGVMPLAGSGSSGGSGSHGSVPGDQYEWDPLPSHHGSSTTGSGSYVGNLLASNWHNWLKNGFTQGSGSGQHSLPGAKPGDEVVLGWSGAAYGSMPIEWNQSFKFSLLYLTGYNAQQELDAGVNLELTGANGSTMYVDASSTAEFELEGNNNLQTDTGEAEIDGNMYVNFLAAGSVRTIKDNETYKKDVDFGAGGQVNIINGGALNLGVGANLNQESGSPINVTNGTLNLGDGNNSGQANYSSFMLTAAAADINIQTSGIMNIYQTGGTAINNVIGGQGSVISNNGVVNLDGVKGAGGTIIAAPLQNYRTLNVIGGSWTFDQKDANGNDLSMETGSINLSFNTSSITCFHGYTQTGGTFFVDTQQATLAVAGGSANFDGGLVDFGLNNGVLNTGGIAFNGATLYMSISGNSTTSNVIKSTSCSIKGSSMINVTLVGDVTTDGPWTLIQNPAGTNITGDFETINLPPGIIENQVTNTWSCSTT